MSRTPINIVAPWLRYWYFAAIGVLTMGLGIQSYRVVSLKADRATYVAAAESARAAAATRVIAVERESIRISAEKEKTHDQGIADLRAAAARRLQALTVRTTALPRVPDAAFQPDEGARRDRLCIQTPFAIALMLAADENTRQLIDLQDWLNEQEKATR